MGFDEQLAELGPGKQLAALPIDKMIGMLGVGVAKAQAALDENAINTAIKLGETYLNLPDPQQDGELISRSLLSLGFMPTFYQFTEATLDLKVEMKWQVETNTSMKLDANVNATVGPVAVGASVGASHGSRFGVDASLMTHVTVRMAALPPPSAFVQFLNRSFGE